MKLTASDALALATSHREAAKAVGDYLYGQWTNLSKADRERLRSIDITLLNLATDLVTQAVGVALDDAKSNLDQLTSATRAAKAAYKKVASAKQAISIATALIGLAAAIPTGNVAGTVAALQKLRKVVADSAATPATPKN